MNETSTMTYTQTIGIDLGDRTHQICVLDAQGKITREGKVNNTRPALEKMFAALPPALVALEACTHSAWISAALEDWGHTVLVANPCKLEAISRSKSKTDQRDARLLAQLARVDGTLLHPIRHRPRQAQVDLGLIKARAALLKARTGLINACKGLVKSLGSRLPACSADAFARQAQEAVPLELREAIEPLIRTVGELSEKIHLLDYKIEQLAHAYPEVKKLSAVVGVGTLTALCYLLTLGEAERFGHSRAVGVYLGLTPAQDQSGEADKQCHITKDGNGYLRVLLILCAQHILGPRSKPCELKEWGMKIAARGGKAAKKRAVVAVARKLAVQLHAVWRSQEPYDPFYAARKGPGGLAGSEALTPPPEHVKPVKAKGGGARAKAQRAKAA